MPRDAVSRTANVGTVGINGLIIAGKTTTIGKTEKKWKNYNSQQSENLVSLGIKGGPIEGHPFTPSTFTSEWCGGA